MMAWMLPCRWAATACRSAEEPARLTHLRISCAPMPSTQSSACRICWMRLLACAPSNGNRSVAPRAPTTFPAQRSTSPKTHPLAAPAPPVAVHPKTAPAG